MNRLPMLAGLVLALGVCTIDPDRDQLRAADNSTSSSSSSAKPSAPPAEFTVKVLADLAYVEGTGAHPKKHKLDLYLPEGAADFPVVVFIHGGAWITGDKNYLFGLYGSVGRAFAKRGVGAAVINYRLTPDVAHPGHIQDVAKAFAWVKKNIKKHGGNPEQMFVSGHSAGGHLAALLSTDEQYLKAEGCCCKDVKGALCLSGVYYIPEFGALFDGIFTKDAKARREASPGHKVNGATPPTLVLYAADDFATLDLSAEMFGAALKTAKVTATVAKIPGKNHFSIITDIGKPGDKTTEAMFAFLAARPGVAIPPAKAGK